MSDQELNFNFVSEDERTGAVDKENRKVFEQTEKDLVFQKGKAVKSQITSSPMFNNMISQKNADAAKSIIIQELVLMSKEEIMSEIKILASMAEENNYIKRSLRAAKFMAIQWLEDERRDAKIKEKCEFILEAIPTFEIREKNIQKPIEKEPEKPSQTLAKENDEKLEENEIQIPEIPNKPLPPPNPPNTPLVKNNIINTVIPNEKLLIITDVQGDYKRLKDTLLKYNIVYLDEKQNIRWNHQSQTKLVISGDLFNKSPFSSWGGKVSYQTFQVIELIRRLIGEAGDKIFLTLCNYDLKICSEQVFRDFSYGFTGKYGGIKTQAQLLPAIISYIENTGFDTKDNIYSLWERDNSNKSKVVFKLKDDFMINGKPDIRLRANEMYLPDISSLRNFLTSLYLELILPPDKRPKSIKELDEKAKTFLKEKEDEYLSPLCNSKERLYFFEGILNGTKTIDFLRKFISSSHKFETKKKDKISISHVSLQLDVAHQFEKAKESKWNLPNFIDVLKESKFLKMKKVSADEMLNKLNSLGFHEINEFLTTEPEDIFDLITEKNLIDSFVPALSPNKLKFGFIKGIEKFQESLIDVDKTGLLGYQMIDRKLEKEFDDIEMKKIADLNETAKQAYAEKVLSDIFGYSTGFKIDIKSEKELICQKGFWKLYINVDKTAALYQDENNAIHVPIKHIALLEYN